jgi:flagellar basal-body rod protein FlgC
MSLLNVFQISAQGMSAQRERLEAASANLANSNTTRTAEGGPYRRRDVVFESTAIAGHANSLGSSSFGSLLDSTSSELESVTARTTVASANDVIMQYQPGHPDADANGYVAMPDVDPLEETVNMLSAARSFEANATAFSTAKEMARISLSLGDA